MTLVVTTAGALGACATADTFRARIGSIEELPGWVLPPGLEKSKLPVEGGTHEQRTAGWSLPLDSSLQVASSGFEIAEDGDEPPGAVRAFGDTIAHTRRRIQQMDRIVLAGLDELVRGGWSVKRRENEA